MKNKTFNKNISHDLRLALKLHTLPLFRNEEERLFLFHWLSGDGERENKCSGLDVKSVQALIEQCARCGVPIEKKPGFGTGKNGVMVILNSPVLINKLEKDVFKKDSIVLLKKIIQVINLDFNDCYITNLVKCEINNSLMRPSQVIENCESITAREIECFSPRIIIVMGDIMPLRKIIKESKGISWHNIEHPITLIKNPELKRKAWDTLKLVIEKIKE